MIFKDGSPGDLLDDLALLASQGYNLGNAGNWFLNFRGGLNGIRSRCSGMQFHRRFVYEWEIGPLYNNIEHHCSSMLFCMDSAVECMVYGLNALGQAVAPTGFRSISDSKALRLISPKDVTGLGTTAPLAGWAQVFPNFQKHFSASSAFLAQLVDNHDVSKHRRHSFSGGTVRNDPPAGFYERLGLGPRDPRRTLIAPMATVLIPKEPKLPTDSQPSDLAAWTTLESLLTDFEAFIQEGLRLANDDAHRTINLPVKQLQ
jgi:hypothetical protein